jgi:MerR family transcriptional regulator, thiopeptide resistance regulator
MKVDKGVTHMEAITFKVGDLSKRTGLSIRTLHYYDEIGLLSPSHRTESGYRVYGKQDIIRLQQIITLKQLEL